MLSCSFELVLITKRKYLKHLDRSDSHSVRQMSHTRLNRLKNYGADPRLGSQPQLRCAVRADSEAARSLMSLMYVPRLP